MDKIFSIQQVNRALVSLPMPPSFFDSFSLLDYYYVYCSSVVLKTLRSKYKLCSWSWHTNQCTKSLAFALYCLYYSGRLQWVACICSILTKLSKRHNKPWLFNSNSSQLLQKTVKHTIHLINKVVNEPRSSIPILRSARKMLSSW